MQNVTLDNLSIESDTLLVCVARKGGSSFYRKIVCRLRIRKWTAIRGLGF